MVAGGLLRLVQGEDKLDYIQFNAQVFFFILLPPIIFEAGYTMKKKRFFENILSILLFAVVGTFISAFTVGFLTYGAARAGLIGIESSNPLQAMLFGSLISSVDPVATLSIIGNPEMNCDPLLYSLVFGESVLNDAVSIVLFHVFNQYASHDDSFKTSDIFSVVGMFFAISTLSVLVGISSGLLCSFVFRRTGLSEYHTYEIQLLFLFALGCFAFAEMAQLSGVVAIFFYAITIAHYNFYNLSEQSKISSTYVFQAMAKTSESVVFVYMGLSLFTSSNKWDIGFLFLGVIFCLIGRVLNIFPLARAANLARDDSTQISNKMQFVMCFAGLRGAVSYALSRQLSPDTGNSHGIEVIQSTTLGIIIFTTFFLGGTTEPVLDKLGLKSSSSNISEMLHNETITQYMPMMQQQQEERQNYGALPSGANGNSGSASPNPRSTSSQRGRIHYYFRIIDDRYMKPIFGGRSSSEATMGGMQEALLAEDSDNITTVT